MKTSDFDYELPPEYIAQSPIEPRDASRLLVLDRVSGSVSHAKFYEIGKFLHPADLLVVNETRVIPARLYGHKRPTGGRVEILLLNRREPLIWEVLVGGKGLEVGKKVEIESGPDAEILEVLEGPRRLLRFQEPIEPYLPVAGHVPLPPYIRKPLEEPERYQTIYAKRPGSAAAPTAGLHFTQRLIAELKEKGINFTTVTLHIGLDTFAPVTEENPEEHRIHTEWCQVPSQAADTINRTHASGGRIIAVGTTTVRALESAARIASEDALVVPFEGPTDLFILPGHRFRAVAAMITNFHLPRSTLLLLVSAFAGRENIMNAYRIAIDEGYRFYSFGDVMLIK
ncbi:MAG TPA: tRNA preQ1(34) S-adenosylmethionine ribosyltransferase-isomerase QueA [Anaerolineales bacterium]